VGQADSAQRAFPRNFDALQEIFDFTAAAFERLGIDHQLLPSVDFAIEELFTNMVKYSTMSDALPEITLRAIADGVEVTLIDRGVEPFDVTQSPEVDIEVPVNERNPGGLGLHLIRRLVDSVEYDYNREERRSRTVFRKTLTAPPMSGASGKRRGKNC
ncbi:MAG: ATP-binding protein, partial [Betaproteobacteria bacterium]